MRLSRRLCLASVLLISAAASVLAGKKVVVPHDFPSIYQALKQAGEGDTVYVSNGVYRENLVLPDGVVLMGQERNKAIIDGSRKAPCIVAADGAVISNLTIRNGTTGILCKNSRPIIKENFIVDNKGAGIHALISLPDIRNNVIYRNEWTGIFLESVRGTRTAIDHNVILENGYCGIFCANRTEVLIKNNILSQNFQYGVYVGPQAKRTRLVYNDLYGNRIQYNSDANVNPSNVSAEPVFMNAAHPDYNYFVRSSSQCKNKGEGGVDIGLITEQVSVELSTDRDGDGILDEVDQCPDVPEDKDAFEDEDGCPDFDNDNDGVTDDKDKCPMVAEDQDGFQDEDGCPDPDNDNDGIPDASDGCPSQPETMNGYKDQDGCPDEKPMEIKQTLILRGVNFKTASAELLEESYYVLENVFNSLEAYTNVKIEVAGHTDNVGKDQYNLVLSYERAKSVANYLIMRGISPDRITARGYGKTVPISSNDTEEGRFKNRRVEIVPVK